MMTSSVLTPAYDEFLDYLLTKLTPEDILNYKLSDKAQNRADELTKQNKLGGLSKNDDAELQQLMELELLFSILKAKAVVATRRNSN